MFGKIGIELSLEGRVAKVLFNYINSLHTTTGISLAELSLNRSRRTVLSLLKIFYRIKYKMRKQQVRDNMRVKLLLSVLLI